MMSKEMVWTTDSWILPLTTSPLSPAKKSGPTTWVLARVFAANVAARLGGMLKHLFGEGNRSWRKMRVFSHPLLGVSFFSNAIFFWSLVNCNLVIWTWNWWLEKHGLWFGEWHPDIEEPPNTLSVFLIAVHGMPQEICFKTSQLCTCFCKTMVSLCNMEDPEAQKSLLGSILCPATSVKGHI